MIAEAASGSTPTALLDSAAGPVDLPITYTAALAFTTVSGHRALRWSAIGDTARAATPIASTKFATRMMGAKAWTYEVIAHGRDVTGTQARLTTIATNVTGYDPRWASGSAPQAQIHS